MTEFQKYRLLLNRLPKGEEIQFLAAAATPEELEVWGNALCNWPLTSSKEDLASLRTRLKQLETLFTLLNEENGTSMGFDEDLLTGEDGSFPSVDQTGSEDLDAYHRLYGIPGHNTMTEAGKSILEILDEEDFFI